MHAYIERERERERERKREREREREKERERETDTLPAARLARFLRATDLRPYCRMKCCLT